MLQISQIENPRCSATIDQMRLRRATALPLAFQYLSSSGSQSEIQVVFGLLIEVPFLTASTPPLCWVPCRPKQKTPHPGRTKASSARAAALPVVSGHWRRRRRCRRRSNSCFTSFVPSRVDSRNISIYNGLDRQRGGGAELDGNRFALCRA